MLITLGMQVAHCNNTSNAVGIWDNWQLTNQKNKPVNYLKVLVDKHLMNSCSEFIV